MESSPNIELDIQLFASIQIVSDHDDRILGSVIGAFLGDSIGSFTEFQKKVTDEDVEQALLMKGGGPFKLVGGQVTDDSELALCLANGLVEGKGLLSIDRIAKYYRYWIRSVPFDIGGTTKQGLQHLLEEEGGKIDGWAKKCYESTKKSYPSEANGALMRITPMAAFCSKLNSEKDVEFAVIADVRMTHPGPTNEDACIAYCLAIRFIARYGFRKLALFDYITEWIRKRDHSQSNIGAYWDAVQDDAEVDSRYGMCWIKLGWTFAFRLLSKEVKDFKEAMRFAISRAGDTDTNACIVGGLIGASIGFRELYRQCKYQVDILLKCDVTNKKIVHPRDAFFNPKNIIPLTLKILHQTKGELVLIESADKEQAAQKNNQGLQTRNCYFMRLMDGVMSLFIGSISNRFQTDAEKTRVSLFQFMSGSYSKYT